MALGPSAFRFAPAGFSWLNNDGALMGFHPAAFPSRTARAGIDPARLRRRNSKLEPDRKKPDLKLIGLEIRGGGRVAPSQRY